MTGLALPELSRWSQATARIVSAGGSDQTSPIDGSSERILRMGDKHAVDVTLPAKERSAAARYLGPWEESQATGATLTLVWPQPPLDVPVGAPLVTGADQLGAVLAVDGFTPHLLLPALSYFSFAAGGRNYLHKTTRDVIIAADGTASLNIAPMLRVSPADNAALEFVQPLVEGFMTAAPTHGLTKKRFYAITFTLQENL